VISPYVRRLRLARELTALRKAANLTIEELAKLIGESRSKIQRLEGGTVRPKEADVLKILDALQVSDEKWAQIYEIAREAAERGWWAPTAAQMGERQALFANLEAGAATIREYMPVVPGLLQTEEYIRAISQYDDLTWMPSASLEPEAMVRGRINRQRMLRRPNGPTYEVVLDELAITRPIVPASVLASQLRRLAKPEDRVRVFVLPIRAQIEAFSVPKSPFSIYTYPDPDDGTVVAVDNVTADLVLTDEEQVQRYELLYERLRKAALPPDDSARLLTETADEIERATS
jgi:transcriptional regulator with XRE-family HTH domain